MGAHGVEHRANVDGNHTALACANTIVVLATRLVNARILLVRAPRNQQLRLVNLTGEGGCFADSASLGGFALVPANSIVAPVRASV